MVGAGLVGQAEHAFYLWEDRERFEFVALADASLAVRTALGARYGIRELHADLNGLLACGLDAIVIAAPDALHPDFAVAALEAGLHVLCEKPLSLTIAGCDRIAAARDRAGRVAQVAYMKRHDPAYKGALGPAAKNRRRGEADFGRGQRPGPRALRGPSADDLAERPALKPARGVAHCDRGAAS